MLPVLRPCTVGDGVERLSVAQQKVLCSWGKSAVESGRVSFFVPASGVASRLVQPLVHLDRHRKKTGLTIQEIFSKKKHPFSEVQFFLTHLPDYALSLPLETHLLPRGHTLSNCLSRRDYDTLLDVLLDPKGLNIPNVPKGLFPFHRYPTVIKNAFEEHLTEISTFGKKQTIHFTVSQKHLSSFRKEARRVVEFYFRRGIRLDVRFSVQDPATNTIALEENGDVVRNADGTPFLRPGGHGALLPNLEKTKGDLVWIRNVDNVPVSFFQAEALRWRLVLTGRLLELQKEALVRFQNPKTPTSVRRALARPWRVCGVVPNSGDPGGGPFWVGGKTESKQIVEASQISLGQKALLKKATHFNPVDMVVSLRDFSGVAHDLASYVDEKTAFVSQKPYQGRTIRVLEHPGLWNGAMAHWNTVFVEIPKKMFHPVKTLSDLLKKGHFLLR